MSELISAVEAADVRFPTSRDLDGSDAMNPEPDYSAAYVTIRTSSGDAGHGLAFTVGRGNDIEVAAIRALAPLVMGLPVEEVLADLGGFSRRLTGDSQLRWLGPEKGAIHMAAAALVALVWDLYERRTGKPVWRLLAELSPEQLVDLIDFRYLQDALTRDGALGILRRAEPGRARRTTALLKDGYPAYTTTPGWLGYNDEKLIRLSKEAVAEGFGQIKLKVGADREADERRMRLALHLHRVRRVHRHPAAFPDPERSHPRRSPRAVDRRAQRRDHPDRPGAVPHHRRQGTGVGAAGFTDLRSPFHRRDAVLRAGEMASHRKHRCGSTARTKPHAPSLSCAHPNDQPHPRSKGRRS
ncbi:hypothetical protein ACFWOB_14405 [Streptomyces sp. NPDC058420]|uniref:hypothetical protein n=1 Tax=Streptomyces sp. NPDC058420 TaxID=3346489 RepID=UPI00364B3B93